MSRSFSSVSRESISSVPATPRGLTVSTSPGTSLATSALETGSAAGDASMGTGDDGAAVPAREPAIAHVSDAPSVPEGAPTAPPASAPMATPLASAAPASTVSGGGTFTIRAPTGSLGLVVRCIAIGDDGRIYAAAEHRSAVKSLYEMYVFDINGQRLGRWRATQRVLQLLVTRDHHSLLACGDRGDITCLDTATLRPSLWVHGPDALLCLADTVSGRLLVGQRLGQVRVVVDGGTGAHRPAESGGGGGGSSAAVTAS